MVADQFYVRIRGRVQGPYDPAKLRALIRRGQLSRMHELSTDKHTWQQASEFPDLFAAADPPPTAAAEPAAAKSAAAGGTRDELALEPPASAPPAYQPEWYYALNQQQYGPVTSMQLVSLIEQGVVPGDALVWREGLPQWIAAAACNELQMAARRTAPRSELGKSSSSGALSQDVLRTLGDTTSWLGFLVSTAFVFAVLLVLLGIAAVLLGVRERLPETSWGGMLTLIYGAVGLWGSTLLWRHNNEMKQYVASPRAELLESSLRRLKAFWTFSSIVVIVILVNLIVIIALAFAAGVAA